MTVRADPRAVRMHNAACRLNAHEKGNAKVAKMAVTDPQAWTEPMMQSAAAILGALVTDLVEVGVDPAMLPAATGDQAPNKPSPRPQATNDPFVYDHTIDGLRGIPLTDLTSVTERAAERFHECGLHTVYDLFMHVPLRYLDRSRRTSIADLAVGATGTTIAHVTSTTVDRTRTGQRVAKIHVADPTGRLSVSFFNAAWQAKRFEPGDEVVVQGRVDQWTTPSGAHRLQMTNPLLDKVGDDTAYIVPIYPQSAKAGLTTWQIHRAAMEAVARMGELSDPVPSDLTSVRQLMGRQEAYRTVHRPDWAGQETPARQRLAYDELLRMQLALRMRHLAAQTEPGVVHYPTGAVTRQLHDRLPFAPTDAQERVVAAITADLARPYPMHRLLQGDVASGKTLVAAQTMLAAVEGGHQAVLMAPTEILATQHHRELANLLDDVTNNGQPVRLAALTNNVRTKARRETLAALAAGNIDIIVGTHALLSDDVQFGSLGVIVVDEQHRFGVEQRAALRAKGQTATADMLVMTATPIPRTAAMTVFGDLDVSVLDQMPPGRSPVRTEWRAEPADLTDRADPTWATVRAQVADGRQAYVVCPLVTESETKAAASAAETHEALATGALAGLRLGLAHGKQRGDDREQVMAEFRAGDLDVLVATTVIEVGLDVPNAAQVVILDPASFGMAQLHQLRGRVGRGAYAGTCLLVGEAHTGSAARRLTALVDSGDGFRLSEVDLAIRGEGSILGARQSGMSDLRVASLEDDRDLLAAARADAATLTDGDPRLARRPGLRAEVENALGVDAEDWLSRS